MNLRGSYTSLRNNSKAAMLAAIEIYNKPQIAYRDECFSILLVNAWELLLKAVLSKNKQRVFYPKERTQPYKTFSVVDGLIKAKGFFPFSIQYEPVAKNINALLTYRNKFKKTLDWGVCCHCYQEVNEGLLKEVIFMGG